MAVRMFVAAELPGIVRESLSATVESLSVLGRQVRWTRPESLHLTLKFLGDVEESVAPRVVDWIRDAAAGHAPLTLQTGDLGAFPSPGKARVVWVGLTGDLESLRDLHREVDEACEGLGFEREKRPFTPHVTLGRARKGSVALPADARSPAPVHFRMDRLTVMKSDLQKGGAVHSPLGYGLLKGE